MMQESREDGQPSFAPADPEPAATSQPVKLGDIEGEFTQASAVAGLNVLVCSWNVGNEEPKEEELRQYLITPTDDTDIVAVGVQECAYKAANGEKQDPHFDNIVKACCGAGFYKVSCHHLWEMRLYVYARTEHKEKISNVVEAKEATGIAHILGNKGGLITKFDYDDAAGGRAASLCFISCHLAAHQGKTKDRNGNIEEICRNARIENKALDVTTQFNHTFFFGDLNYRIDLPDGVGLEESEQWAMVKSHIDAGEWDKLYAGDQLASCLRQEKCLDGFVDTKPQFMPTFKVLRQAATTYKDQRIPAYCDRILTKSMPGCASHLTNTMFKNCPEVSTSDHKPVHGTYTVTLPPRVNRSPAETGGGPVLIFDELSADNLLIADILSSDPYVLFFSNPPDLFASKKTPQTEMVKRTLSPTWKRMRMPPMRIKNANELKHVSLVLSVWDADLGPNVDDPLGNAIIALTDLVDEQYLSEATAGGASPPKDFTKTLYLDGKLAKEGSIIKGKAHIEWSPDAEEYDSNSMGGCYECCGGAGTKQCSIQ